MAEAHHVTVAPHSPLGPVSTTVGVPFAASTPNFLILEYQPDQSGPSRDLARKPLVFEDGHIRIPDQPGLGIELNESAFAGKPLKPWRRALVVETDGNIGYQYAPMVPVREPVTDPFLSIGRAVEIGGAGAVGHPASHQLPDLSQEFFFGRLEMNRRIFLAGTSGVVAMATTLSATTPPRDRKRVLIPRWEPERVEDLRSAVPEVELIIAKDSLEQVRDADAAFGFIDAAHIRAGKRLRWVQQGSAGVEGVVNIPELVERDIVLTNMQRTFALEIADQALAYLLAFTRGLTHFIRKPSEGTWSRPPEVVLEELQGKTLLVIALGGIGSEIARRAFGFGMRVLATDPKVIEKPLFVEELHRPDTFHRLLTRADVVASAVPLTPLSRRMIGEKEFGMMKRGTILINVSRGGVVDTEALVAALDRGQVAAAGLDVTDPEPLPAGHPLWKRNVIITPHSAGQSPGGQRRVHELFRENLRRFAAGEMLLNIVDKKAGY